MISLFMLTGLVYSNDISNYKVADIFTKMRDMSFNVKPSELKIKQEIPGQIYGVFMETGLENVAYSLRCFKEGTISIYFTNGGGMIGIGEHENARKKSLDLIEYSTKFKKKAQKTNKRDLPTSEQTIFYFLAFDGIFILKSNTNDLENENHELYTLYMKAQDVISEARIIDENKNKK
jgi:hypothetical protein